MSKKFVWKFAKFLMVGGTGYLLYMLAFMGMRALHWPELLAIALAPVANILYNFILHDNWTFRNNHDSNKLVEASTR
jgi:putative flippase GtrA